MVGKTMKRVVRCERIRRKIGGVTAVSGAGLVEEFGKIMVGKTMKRVVRCRKMESTACTDAD